MRRTVRWLRSTSRRGFLFAVDIALGVVAIAASTRAPDDIDGDQITVHVTIAPRVVPPGDGGVLPATGADPGLLIGVALLLVVSGAVVLAFRHVGARGAVVRSAAEVPSSCGR